MASTALAVVVAALLLMLILGGLLLALAGVTMGLGLAGFGLFATNDRLAGRWLTPR